ncbi:carboxylesterase/lipase family protein [Frondihabitans cladoniiphilus]|uniref:Carboxylic ester hydrolase n=1 Tax=Frondihabitans cladoniiphilus TaxID=715785 RepID=A0ABP8WAL8_9MICO
MAGGEETELQTNENELTEALTDASSGAGTEAGTEAANAGPSIPRTLTSPLLRRDVTGGTIEGTRQGPIDTWRGIPFAAPPVGDLRFRAPQPVVPWSGVRSAGDFGAINPQPVRRRSQNSPAPVGADEDSLTLNIQAPAGVQPGEGRPVMVFIHGGGYSGGSSRDFSGHGESFVLEGGVLYVSFNYRLGSLGYLDFTRYATPERPIESNLGLRDQLAALEWVRDNIAQFGGDPANVTIFGESAGAGSVTTLLGVPRADGLFARAIAQSAPPSAVFRSRLSQTWAEEFVTILREQRRLRLEELERAASEPGYDPEAHDDVAHSAFAQSADASNNGGRKSDAPREHRFRIPVVTRTRDARAARAHAPQAAHATQVTQASQAAPDPSDLALLLEATPDELVAATSELSRQTPDAYPGAFCLAPTVDGEFVPEHPMRAVREGRGIQVPLIIGTNFREGSVFRGPLDILPTTAPRIGGMFSRAPSAGKKRMHASYPGLPSRHDGLTFGGDYAFWYPSTLLADWHSRHAPTRAYRFDFAPRLLRLVGLDATHGVEMFAPFDRFDLPLVRAMTSLGGRESYAAAGRRMRDAWLAFAKDGSFPDDWPAYGEETRTTRIIDVEDRLEDDPRHDARLAWKAFLPIFETLW